MNILRPKLKLVKGTRFVSFLFIGCSIVIAAGILFAANMYYNIDTGEIVMEEIQRTTGLIRAVGGVIIGGTATQDPTAGYDLEVIGQTRLATTTFATGTVELIAANQLLKFTGGTGYYIGLKAPSLSTTSEYALPTSTAPTTNYYLTVNPSTGQMNWGVPAGTGGQIFAVGDVKSGEAFTTSTAAGTSLWFHDSGKMGELIIGTLTANATYTLPDLTGTIALQNAGNLGTGGVLFANSGLIATSSNFYWDNANRRLSLGTTSTANGIIRLYGGTSGYTEFQAVASGDDITYTWPTDAGDSNYILTTDGSGVLAWKSATGTAGAIDTHSSPQAGQVTFFYDSDTLAGDANFTWSTSTNKLTLVVGLISPLIQSAGALTLEALGGNILLNPSTGIVQLATSTYIRTHGGYEIGATGTQILREMIPILGFDLPVQTATTSYVKISKDLENYPFQSAATGTTRVHKLVFRYAASTTADIDWRVSTSTGQTYSSSTLPQPDSEDLEKGDAYVTTTTIPADGTDWWLDIKTVNVPDVVRVFQIFLAAYDQIQ